MPVYTLVLNRKPHTKGFTFSYGHTRDIQLSVSSYGASITKELTKDYQADFLNSYLGGLLKEGMKRASLVYLLKYQKPLRIKTATLSISRSTGGFETFDLSNNFVLFSMINKKYRSPISDKWKQNEVIQNVLGYQKSADTLSRETAALYAYLLGKTKTFETERFSYMWMAFNGLYAALDRDNKGDRSQMLSLLRRFKLSEEILSQETRDYPSKMAMLYFRNIQDGVTLDSLRNGAHSGFAEYIAPHLKDKNGKQVKQTAVGFMMTDFPYYLRCSVFHANRPVELFSFADDMELNALRIAAGLLEEFLDEHLVSMFENEA